jgi:anti-anti-sigma factor
MGAMTTEHREIMVEHPISMDGELTISTVAEIKARLNTALEQKEPVVLDLHNVEELDTAGLQLLLALQRTGNKRVRFINPSEAVRQILALANAGAQLGLSATDHSAAGG